MISRLAGKPAPLNSLVDVPKLVTCYYACRPDVSMSLQRVAFGTSGHRGTSVECTFNEWHVLAITQAICDYRKLNGVTGPLFVGADTHALSAPAAASALEVLAANGVHTMISRDEEPTPTPAISHAIISYNRGRTHGLADGVVITPSHNPPDSGGYKYNPVHGGPADTGVTRWIGARANALLEAGLDGIQRWPYKRALCADTTRRHDYATGYVNDLGNVIDMDAIRAERIRMGVDPLGGAGVHYWSRIVERYGVDLTIVSEEIDPTFRFMSLDWDGKIRMDPSSKFAMQRLIKLKDDFDVAFGCDTDYDRHGIVVPGAGLMEPNHYLAVSIDYLFRHRSQWNTDAGIGKTVVSSQVIDQVATRLGRKLIEVPVGFKWFVPGLADGSLGFGGEESAGASFLRIDGTVWTTDKDGMIAALLSAEMMARTGRNPGEAYGFLTHNTGLPVFRRVDAPATPPQKDKLASLSAHQIRTDSLAGEKITGILARAPGNDAPIGGVKVIAASGWFAARPSGTEEIYKIYAESFQGDAHLQRILTEAHEIVDRALTGPDSDQDHE